MSYITFYSYHLLGSSRLFKCCQILIGATLKQLQTNEKSTNAEMYHGLNKTPLTLAKKIIINQETFDSIQKSLNSTDFFSVRTPLQMISG